MNDAPLPEPLESFLQHPPSVPSAQRDRLLRETSARLPRRRTWRSWATISVAATLALGAVTAYVVVRLQHIAPPPAPVAVERKPDPPPEVVQPVIAAAPELPLDAEWRAFDTDDDRQRAKLYFRAGDLYLERAQDIESALRCYREAIQCCDARDLETDVNDNWLVMALKRDQRKEQ